MQARSSRPRSGGPPEAHHAATRLCYRNDRTAGGRYDYRATVAVWFRGLFAANPQPELMATAPLLYQVHAISAWFLFALWPFSRLVHAWSYPVLYLGRPWILYRGYRTRARSHPASITARAGR